jgi:hypothetical protein
MDNDRFARYGAATGIIAVVLILIGFSIFGSGLPSTDASSQDWGSFFTDHQSRIQLGVTIVGVGLFFFIWFLGSLRSAIAAAEGGTGRLASIAFGGGLIGVVALLLAVTAAAAAAFRPDQVDPNLTRALNDFGTLAAAPGAAGFTALFAATAIAGYRHGALPAPIAGFSALAAITQPLAYGIAVTDHGAFASDGVFGLIIPVITFSLAILTASVALMRQPGGYAGSAAQ